jgi:hypothetical protein
MEQTTERIIDEARLDEAGLACLCELTDDIRVNLNDLFDRFELGPEMRLRVAFTFIELCLAKASPERLIGSRHERWQEFLRKFKGRISPDWKPLH